MSETATAVGSAATGDTGGSSAPASFADAFAGEATPSSSSPAQSSDAAAAGQPEAAQGSPQQDDRSPFIPRQRFDEVNNSLKELKAWKEQHGWVESASANGDLQRAIDLAGRIGRGSVEERVAGLQQIIQELRQSDPAMDAAFRSFAGKALATLRSQGQAQAPPQEPQMVQVQLEDGTVVPMPRDPAAWLAHQKQQWLAELRQELQPVTQTVQTLQQREAALQQQAQIHQFVTTTYEDVKTWPGMDTKEAQAAVANALRQARINPNDPREVAMALDKAYRTVVLPTFTSTAQAQLLDSLKTKAAASTSVNPGGTAASTPRSYSSFKDLPPEAWR